VAKKKVCKSCKLFVDKDVCPLCKNSNFAANWQGRIYIADPNKSYIAKQMGLKEQGEYAIKVK